MEDREMNTVLISPERTDSRLDRCQHPRLRQALMFQPPQSVQDVQLLESRVTKPASAVSNGHPEGQKIVKSVTSFAATTFVRIMSFLFDGLQFVTAPL